MRLVAIDLETSGLDPATCVITEIGWALWDTDRSAPLMTGGGLVAPAEGEAPLSPEIVTLTAITDEDRKEFGTIPEALFADVRDLFKKHGAERFVAHNAPFDRSFLEPVAASIGFTGLVGLPWIDTRTDLPLTEETTSGRLQHLLADHGIIQPFRHRALFDALGCCLLLQCYPIEEVIRRADAPSVTLQALVSFDEKELAKARRYHWDAPTKAWLKTLKDFEVAAEETAAPFRTRRVA